MKSRISIVIPAYNRAEYIADSINSVLNQDYGKYEPEIIIIDDGSSDNTEQIVKTFGNKVIYKKTKHSGKPAVARNIALAMAKGELVAFQDSDDIWISSKMKWQLPLFDDSNIILAYGNAEIMDADGKSIGKTVVPPNKLKIGEKFSSLVKDNVVSTSTVIVRRAALDSVGGFDESDALRAVEDYKLWLELSAKYPDGLKHLDRILNKYRRHQQNISEGSQIESIKRIINAYKALWETDLTDKQRLVLEEQMTIMEENWSRVYLTDMPQKCPAISVVMGVWNAENFMNSALKNILSQTFKDFEYIIINDGSADKTADAIKKCQDPRIRFIPQTHHGLVHTLNRGIRIARGEFIARMDADDLSKPKRFEKEIAWLNEHPEATVVSSFFRILTKKH